VAKIKLSDIKYWSNAIKEKLQDLMLKAAGDQRFNLREKAFKAITSEIVTEMGLGSWIAEIDLLQKKKSDLDAQSSNLNSSISNMKRDLTIRVMDALGKNDLYNGSYYEGYLRAQAETRLDSWYRANGYAAYADLLALFESVEHDIAMSTLDTEMRDVILSIYARIDKIMEDKSVG
jgi:hypothetical protein